MKLRCLIYFFSLIFFLPFSYAESKKVLTFVYEDYPPYEYSTDGGLDGISARRVRTISEKLGYSPRFIFAPWTRALNLVRNGEVDGIFSLNKNKDREQFMQFPKYPVAWSEERLFSLKNKVQRIDHFSQIPHNSVGVVSGYTYGKSFDSLVIPRKEVARGNENLITRLNKGWLEVIVMNRNVFDYYVKKMKINPDRFEMHPLVINAEDLYMAFSKKSKAGTKAVKAFSEELKRITKLKKPGQ